jgi:integrase
MASLITRGKTYYIQWRVGKNLKRKSLKTTSYQIAREKLLQFESARLRGEDDPLPMRTPLPEILGRYVEYVRVVKTPKSAQTDVYYLRQMFGPICPALEITSRRPSMKAMKRPPRPGQDRRFKVATIEVDCLEQITTADISNFITAHVKSRGLKPRTANRYREIVNRLFNWAMQEQGVRLPGNSNPASKVAKYRENAPEIRFLSLAEIDQQLRVLRGNRLLQTMVAMYVYAGLR